MFKKLRDRVANKKGFTLVELIVVIVIILVMAAVMIPNVLKYTKQATEASTKEAAASMLTEVQVRVADEYIKAGEAPGEVELNGVKATNVTTVKNEAGEDVQGSLTINDKGDSKVAQFIVDSEGQVAGFAYQDGKHYATWTNVAGWKLDGTAY